MFGLMIAVERIEAALARSRAALPDWPRSSGVQRGCWPVWWSRDPRHDLRGRSFFGFWYGHIQRHPRRPLFVSQIVWTDRLINAQTVPLLFRRFHYWIKDRLEYQPCAVQSAGDAYAESDSLEAAADALILMIERFDIDRRTGFEGTGFEDSRPEIRITEVYGLMGPWGRMGRFRRCRWRGTTSERLDLSRDATEMMAFLVQCHPDGARIAQGGDDESSGPR